MLAVRRFPLDNGTVALGYFNNYSTGGDAGDWDFNGPDQVVADFYDAFLTDWNGGHDIDAGHPLVLADISFQSRPLPARVLAWTGAEGTDFSNDINWEDMTVRRPTAGVRRSGGHGYGDIHWLWAALSPAAGRCRR